MIKFTDAPAIVRNQMDQFAKSWCVVEYMVADGTPTPPVVVFITATKLSDAFSFSEATRNSEWRRIIRPEYNVAVMITAVGSKAECQIEANKRVMATIPRPRCNLHGYNAFATTRALICSNGQEYESQSDAAKQLGINQGAISRQLKGELNSVAGYVFTYKELRK